MYGAGQSVCRRRRPRSFPVLAATMTLTAPVRGSASHLPSARAGPVRPSFRALPAGFASAPLVHSPGEAASTHHFAIPRLAGPRAVHIDHLYAVMCER